MKNVLVTGANGHLGCTLVKLLLERGYKVRASVRDPKSIIESGLFDGCDVQLVPLELGNAEQMQSAVRGMDGVFHVAATFRLWARNPRKEIIEPTVEGVRQALQAATGAGIRRFIYTSSVVAVGLEGTCETPFNESHWQGKTRSPYMSAKTLAEHEAWRMAEQFNLDMVAICPGGIIGPNFRRHTPSTTLFEELLQERVPGILPMSLDYVDVRDVAEAHLLAYENPQSSGRYICTNKTFRFEELLSLVSKVRKDLKLPHRRIPRAMLPLAAVMDGLRHHLTGSARRITLPMLADYFGKGQHRYFDTTRIRKELGWKPRPIETTINDTFDWITHQFGGTHD